MERALEMEIESNFDFFLRRVGSYLPEKKGQFALLRNADVVSFHTTVSAAEMAGAQRFGDGIYSIQEVTDEPVDLGFFSYAVNSREA